MSDSTFETPFLKTLHDLRNVYDRFVPDQVLTHHNLNKILDYFEDETRQSRVYTVGVGIGCGLDFSIEKNEDNKTIIRIHDGLGITTDGDLIVVNQAQYGKGALELAFAAPFENKADYTKFEDFKLFELYTKEEAENLADKRDLDSFTNFSDYYILAYVENFSENPGICSGTGCDDTGEPVYVNNKFLLIDKTGFNNLSSKENDSIFHQYNILELYDDLSEYAALKPMISSEESEISSEESEISSGDVTKLTDLIALYEEAIKTNNVVDSVIKDYFAILNYLQKRLDVTNLNISETEIKKCKTEIFGLGQFPKSDFQYRYDLLKDLIDTYTEIKAQLLHLKTICLPDLSAFPKHLLLGSVEQKHRKSSRHAFYPSKLSAHDNLHLSKISTLMLRFYHQITQYQIHNSKKEYEIEITPSRNYSFKLGDRSIPFYYETNQELVKYWNFEDLQNRRETHRLAYHKSQLSKSEFIQMPLKYDHQGHDFYRIEGHIGKSYETVLKKLKKDRALYNLAFDIKTVSLGDAIKDFNVDDYSCQFEDLRTLLKAWRDEFECLLKNGFQFFNQYDYKNPGENKSKTKYKDFILDKNIRADHLGPGIKENAFNFPNFTMAGDSGTTKNIRLLEVEGDTRLLNLAGRVQPVSMRSTAEDDQGFLIQNATNYAVQIANSYDSDAIYKVAKEHILENVGGYEDTVQEMIYIDTPVKIIADMIAVQGTFVDDIQVYARETELDRFKKNLNKLCFDLSKAKEDIIEARQKEVFGRMKKDSMFEFMVYELSKLCCFKAKISWLVKEIDSRKSQLFDNLKLSEVVKKHPGLEHMAGVPKGGTFLMVYEGQSTKTTTYSDQIVADFCLPYMCMSECTPDVVVINQQMPVDNKLSLDRQVYCIIDGEEISKGIFTVEPEDAIITSDQGDKFIENNKHFNPNYVEDKLLGLPISFSVNEKPTSLTAFVFKIPNKDYFNNPEHLIIKVAKNDDNESADIAVIPKTPYDNKSYLTYFWVDSAGNKVSSKRILEDTLPIENGAVTAKYVLSIGVNHPDAECETEVEVLIQEKLEDNTEVDLNFSPEVFCFKADAEPKKVPLEVVPEDAAVTSDLGEGFIKENQFIPHQVPDQLLGKAIKFKVNDQLVDKTATVYKLPEDNHFNNKNFEVVVKSVDTNNNLANVNIIPVTPYDSNAYLTYNWLNANNESLTKTKILNTSLQIDGSQLFEDFTLQLGVNNELADCLESYKIKVEEKIEIEEENTCYQAYNTRLAKYNFKNAFTQIANKVDRTSFGSKLTKHVINRAKKAINDAKKLDENEFKNNIALIVEFVDTLETLSNDYIQDVEKSNYLNLFMMLHEILVVMILELSRCKNDAEVAEIDQTLIRFEQIVQDDHIIFVEFGEDYNALRANYFKTYKPKSQRLLAVKSILNIN